MNWKTETVVQSSSAPKMLPDHLINPIGKWPEYASEPKERIYGREGSYALAAQFLDLPGWVVEDWGCGWGYAREFFKNAKYIGIDGSQSKYCDEVDDLRTRQSSPDGILLRHVLEHNLMWQWILQGAIRCKPKRICIVSFMPFVDAPVAVPDQHQDVVLLHLVESDLDAILSGFSVEKLDTSQPDYYERIWFCTNNML